jgi:hypothetical protein
VSRLGFVVVLVAAMTAVLVSVQPAGGSGACKPIKGMVDAQLQTSVGELVLQGVVEATLGGVPVTGSIVTVLSTPIQGIGSVDNPEPTEGFGEAEVEDLEKRERRTIATADSGLFIPTQQASVFLLVMHAQVTGLDFGEMHYQGIVDLETDAAAWDISGAVCL